MRDAGMRDECSTRFATQSGNDVERTCRQTGSCRDFGDAQKRQTRVFRRLDDTGVARGERTADRATKDLQRVVPRNHVSRYAMRLTPREDRVAVGIRNRLAVQLVAGAGVELEVAGAGG